MRYHRGDELVLKVEDDFGYADKTYRSVKVQVIGFNTDSYDNDAEYLVYVPPYETVRGTWVLRIHHADWHGIDYKFIGENVMFISSHHPIYKHLPAASGERCERCRDFFSGAEKPDSGTFRCASCRFNPYR